MLCPRSAAPSPFTQVGFDAWGKTTSETDPAGQTKLMEYDANGRLIAVTLGDKAYVRTKGCAKHRGDTSEGHSICATGLRGTQRERRVTAAALYATISAKVEIVR